MYLFIFRLQSQVIVFLFSLKPTDFIIIPLAFVVLGYYPQVHDIPFYFVCYYSYAQVIFFSPQYFSL